MSTRQAADEVREQAAVADVRQRDQPAGVVMWQQLYEAKADVCVAGVEHPVAGGGAKVVPRGGHKQIWRQRSTHARQRND